MPIPFEQLNHELFMREALKQAEEALTHGERPIGAVIVHDGVIIARGRARHNERHSEVAHAEMNAMLDGQRFLHEHIHESVLYTTVEPCVMCLGAAVMSDLYAIVFALADHNINASQMLEMPYVRRHIKHYVGGGLEAESAALWEKTRQAELALIRGERVLRQ